MKITLQANLKAISDFPKFVQQVKKEIIETGLDDILNNSLVRLREELMKYLTEEGKTDIQSKSEVNSTEILGSIPQSMEMWINQLTGANLNQFNSSKDFSTLSESKVMYINEYKNSNKGFDYLSTRLRMPIGPNETFTQHFFQATNFFNNTIYLDQDSSGNTKVLVNPGVLLNKYVKVVCSTDTGDTVKSRNRFQDHKVKRNQAEWALTMEGAQYVQNNFIDISPAIRELQQNNFDNAVALLKMATAKNNSIQNSLIDKIDGAKTGKSANSSTTAYIRITQAIKSMKIEKVVKENGTTYAISTPSDDESKEYVDFFDYMNKQISLWKTFGQDNWFAGLIKKAIKLINNFKG